MHISSASTWVTDASLRHPSTFIACNISLDRRLSRHHRRGARAATSLASCLRATGSARSYRTRGECVDGCQLLFEALAVRLSSAWPRPEAQPARSSSQRWQREICDRLSGSGFCGALDPLATASRRDEHDPTPEEDVRRIRATSSRNHSRRHPRRSSASTATRSDVECRRMDRWNISVARRGSVARDGPVHRPEALRPSSRDNPRPVAVDERIQTIRELCSFENRLAGTDSERRAANRLAERLRARGRRVDVEPIYVHPQMPLVQALHCAARLRRQPRRDPLALAGFALVLLAATSMYFDLNARLYLFRRLFFRRASQNVVARGRPPGRSRPPDHRRPRRRRAHQPALPPAPGAASRKRLDASCRSRSARSATSSGRRRSSLPILGAPARRRRHERRLDPAAAVPR